MSFTDEEIAHLRSQPLARVAPPSPGGQPDVVPVPVPVEFEFEFDGTFFWIGGSGQSVLGTRKFRSSRAVRRTPGDIR
ncbi:hypothetical protein [Planobispora rosea]|uniref:hypothetical protein n=1 Tax=Planobispora rosea TaxID=35762 RepID=UPI00083A82CA|nr:hypothetical protein [Planobispora rosea]